MMVKVAASGLTQTYNVDSRNSLVLQKRVVSHIYIVLFNWLVIYWVVYTNCTEVI